MTSTRTIPLLSAAWCLGYAALAAAWACGAPGFPFGADDPRARETGSWLSGATPGWAGALLAIACAAGAVASLIVAASSPVAPRGGGRWRSRLAAAVLVPVAFMLLFVLPDVRILQNLAYSLSGYFGMVDGRVFNQAACIVGGALAAWTALLVLRRPPCRECRRPEDVAGERDRWRRIGRRAVIVAICAQLPYGIQRAAWNLGIPLGVSREFVDGLAADITAKGINPLMMWMLVVPDVIGALLTLGLVMSWGERVPAWVPLLGGRRVPVSLAVVPATVVSVAVIVAGMSIYRFAWESGGVKGSGVPGLLWLPWGVALATATVAYVMRRRRTCPGHGTPAPVAEPAAGAGRP